MSEAKLASALARLQVIRAEKAAEASAAKDNGNEVAAWALRHQVGWLQHQLHRIEGRIGARYEEQRASLAQKLIDAEALLALVKPT